MKTIGYTELQAERLMHKIEVAGAKACDDLTAMYRLVSDHENDAVYLHEEIHTKVRILQDIVRRRKR